MYPWLAGLSMWDLPSKPDRIEVCGRSKKSADWRRTAGDENGADDGDSATRAADIRLTGWVDGGFLLQAYGGRCVTNKTQLMLAIAGGQLSILSQWLVDGKRRKPELQLAFDPKCRSSDMV